jgi:hypothetical protein
MAIETAPAGPTALSGTDPPLTTVDGERAEDLETAGCIAGAQAWRAAEGDDREDEQLRR